MAEVHLLVGLITGCADTVNCPDGGTFESEKDDFNNNDIPIVTRSNFKEKSSDGIISH